MKLCRCPICHSDLHFETLIEDEAGRELLYKVSQLTHGCAKPMVNYLGLFKPAKSNLNNARALKILDDVLQLFPCSLQLAHCLTETVEAIRKKRREQQRTEPLTNHNYLKSVYESQKVNFAHSTVSHNPDQRVQQAIIERDNLQKQQANFSYIEQLIQYGQEDKAKQLPFYQDWLAHKHQSA